MTVPELPKPEPKYAPAREDGTRPYVVERAGWGKRNAKIGWGKTPTEARHNAYGRMGVGEYIIGVRRATPTDMEAHS